MSASDRVVIETGIRRRRRHSELFKSDAVEACWQAGVSVAAVALSRGLNANLLRQWLAGAERSKAPISEPTDRLPRDASAVMLTWKPVDGPIRIEVRPKDQSLMVIYDRADGRGRVYAHRFLAAGWGSSFATIIRVTKRYSIAVSSVS